VKLRQNSEGDLSLNGESVGMDRRSFLRLASTLGGAAALTPSAAKLRWLEATSASTSASASAASILNAPAASSPIDTIVVLMMENRSVDHYLGWLATDEAYLEAGRSRYGAGFGFAADQTQSFLDPATAAPAATYDIVSDSGTENAYRGCGHPDPGHGWTAGRAQRDGGFLAPGSGNDRFALSYYNADTIPMHALLARNFTTFDQYHCSVLGPTYPNREYMHSAQSGGIKNNALPPQAGHNTGFSWDTIWDRLRTAGVSCGYYFVDLPAIALWGARMAPIAHHVERFFADAAAGTLPQVVFVDPGFTTGFRTDDHPHADIRAGQKFIFDVFKSFAESPHWNRGVFFVNYDEWGGFFDHAQPPKLPDDRTSTDDAENFGQAGFRVPCLMASPFAQPGFVDHQLYDHTSILRFIEWRYLGAPAEGPAGSGWYLTARDRNANNIGASLLASPTSAHADLELLPQIPVASMPCEGDALSGLPGLDSLDGGFQQMLDTGWAESMGYRINPRLPQL
jgi:phospholipase C